MKPIALLILLPLFATAGCELNPGEKDDTGLNPEGDADADADADTDTDADADADADADSDADTDCEWADDAVIADTGLPDASVEFEPYYFIASAVLMIDDNEIWDFDYDGEANSSYVEFVFFGDSSSGYAELCSIIYDGSTATETTSPWKTSSGGQVYGAFDLDLADGYTDCGVLNAGDWDTTDMREVLENHKWGVGIGEMVDVKTDLKPAVEDAGLDWDNDWAPFVSSGYLYWDLLGGAYEWMYTFGYDTSCDETIIDTDGYLTPLPMPTSGPLDRGLWIPNGFYYIDAKYLAK